VPYRPSPRELVLMYLASLRAWYCWMSELGVVGTFWSHPPGRRIEPSQVNPLLPYTKDVPRPRRLGLPTLRRACVGVYLGGARVLFLYFYFQ
jgi:hypothetical protein